MKTRATLFILALFLLVISFPRLSFAVAVTSPVQEKKQEYLLPFPGILPDHPLYFFKQVRDGILDRLIVNPLRKAEFHILQADKRLNMGVVLLEQKKETLAETTISKGEKYMERAMSGLSAFKSMGRPVPASIIDKLTRSMEKHVEVLEKTNFTGTLALVKKLQSEIEKLK